MQLAQLDWRRLPHLERHHVLSLLASQPFLARKLRLLLECVRVLDQCLNDLLAASLLLLHRLDFFRRQILQGCVIREIAVIADYFKGSGRVGTRLTDMLHAFLFLDFRSRFNDVVLLFFSIVILTAVVFEERSSCLHEMVLDQKPLIVHFLDFAVFFGGISHQKEAVIWFSDEVITSNRRFVVFNHLVLLNFVHALLV